MNELNDKFNKFCEQVYIRPVEIYIKLKEEDECLY